MFTTVNMPLAFFIPTNSRIGNVMYYAMLYHEKSKWHFVQLTGEISITQKFKTKKEAMKIARRYLERGAVKQIAFFKRGANPHDFFGAHADAVYTDALQIPERVG